MDSTFKWIDIFSSLVPNPHVKIEVAKFDIAKMINPNTDYTNEDAALYKNTKCYVLARDGYTCQVCKKRAKSLRVHHITYRSCGGTNRAENLIAVCSDCHTPENHKEGAVLWRWMKSKKKPKLYKEPAFMNVIRKRTMERYSNASFTYGYETSSKRKLLILEKTHYNDAITISGITKINTNPSESFYYKQFRKKKRSLHESFPRKGKSKKNLKSERNNKNVKFRNGFYLGDEVLYNKQRCWVYGFSGGKMGRELIIRNIYGDIVKMPDRKNSLSVSMSCVKLVKHNNSWIYNKD